MRAPAKRPRERDSDGGDGGIAVNDRAASQAIVGCIGLDEEIVTGLARRDVISGEIKAYHAEQSIRRERGDIRPEY